MKSSTLVDLVPYKAFRTCRCSVLPNENNFKLQLHEFPPDFTKTIVNIRKNKLNPLTFLVASHMFRFYERKSLRICEGGLLKKPVPLHQFSWHFPHIFVYIHYINIDRYGAVSLWKFPHSIYYPEASFICDFDKLCVYIWSLAWHNIQTHTKDSYLLRLYTLFYGRFLSNLSLLNSEILYSGYTLDFVYMVHTFFGGRLNLCLHICELYARLLMMSCVPFYAKLCTYMCWSSGKKGTFYGNIKGEKKYRRQFHWTHV